MVEHREAHNDVKRRVVRRQLGGVGMVDLNVRQPLSQCCGVVSVTLDGVEEACVFAEPLGVEPWAAAQFEDAGVL